MNLWAEGGQTGYGARMFEDNIPVTWEDSRQLYRQCHQSDHTTFGESVLCFTPSSLSELLSHCPWGCHALLLAAATAVLKHCSP